MTKEMCSKLKALVNGIDVSEDSSSVELKRFLGIICNDDSFDDSAAGFIFESFDELNDQVVPLLSVIYVLHKEPEWYQCILFLFEENIDLADCHKLIVKSIISDMKCEEFDEILKNSPSQNEFKSVLLHHLECRYGVNNDSVFYDPELGKDYIIHLKNENQNLEERNNYLQNSLEASYDRIKELSLDNEDLSSRCSSLDSDVCRLNKELSHSNAAYTLLELKYNNNRSRLEELEKENILLFEEIKESSGPSVDERETLISENDDLKVEIDRLNNVIVELREDLFVTKEELEKANAQLYPVDDSVDLQSNDFEFHDNYNGFNSHDFTDSLFEDDIEEYSQEDVVPVKDNTSFIKKTCDYFANLLSGHFEKKFLKKTSEEQKRYIFIALRKNSYSLDINSLVSETADKLNPDNMLELYRLISNKGSDNDIIRFCRNNANAVA